MNELKIPQHLEYLPQVELIFQDNILNVSTHTSHTVPELILLFVYGIRSFKATQTVAGYKQLSSSSSSFQNTRSKAGDNLAQTLTCGTHGPKRC